MYNVSDYSAKLCAKKKINSSKKCASTLQFVSLCDHVRAVWYFVSKEESLACFTTLSHIWNFLPCFLYLHSHILLPELSPSNLTHPFIVFNFLCNHRLVPPPPSGPPLIKSDQGCFKNSPLYKVCVCVCLMGVCLIWVDFSSLLPLVGWTHSPRYHKKSQLLLWVYPRERERDRQGKGESNKSAAWRSCFVLISIVLTINWNSILSLFFFVFLSLTSAPLHILPLTHAGNELYL